MVEELPKPHIVRLVADEARRQYFRRPPGQWPRPRIREQEIGVQFGDGAFIPYADLGYSRDDGFFRLSEMEQLPNDAAPFATAGRLIEPGQIIVTTGATARLSNDDVRQLLARHASGDYGEYGEFYDLDISDDMLRGASQHPLAPGLANKVNTLTGLDAIVSAYTLDDHRFWVMTEAGENRTTVILYAGPANGM
jgi:hypothetical protein